MTIYLAGYTGQKPENLLRCAQELDALVMDIRFSPNSRVEHWRREGLESLLGTRYVWLQSLGNRNYQDGPIELMNPVSGCAFVKRVAERQHVILLCACAERRTCHRDVVGTLLQRDGRDVQDLNWNGQEALI